jgi:hypothetical protein
MDGREGGFINISDMFLVIGGKGAVYAHEVHVVKQRVALDRVPFYLINFLPPVTRDISILLLSHTHIDSKNTRGNSGSNSVFFFSKDSEHVRHNSGINSIGRRQIPFFYIKNR